MNSPDAALPDFDEALLLEIKNALPDAEFRGFVEEYLASAEARMARIATLDAAALSDLKVEAHRVISTAGSFGLRRASAIARRLETACAENRADEAARLKNELTESSRTGWAAMKARFLA